MEDMGARTLGDRYNHYPIADSYSLMLTERERERGGGGGGRERGGGGRERDRQTDRQTDRHADWGSICEHVWREFKGRMLQKQQEGLWAAQRNQGLGWDSEVLLKGRMKKSKPNKTNTGLDCGSLKDLYQ